MTMLTLNLTARLQSCLTAKWYACVQSCDQCFSNNSIPWLLHSYDTKDEPQCSAVSATVRRAAGSFWTTKKRKMSHLMAHSWVTGKWEHFDLRVGKNLSKCSQTEETCKIWVRHCSRWRPLCIDVQNNDGLWCELTLKWQQSDFIDVVSKMQKPQYFQKYKNNFIYDHQFLSIFSALCWFELDGKV